MMTKQNEMPEVIWAHWARIEWHKDSPISLESFTVSLDKVHPDMDEYIRKDKYDALKEAVIDLVDGKDQFDLCYDTGLTLDRCMGIRELYEGLENE